MYEDTPYHIKELTQSILEAAVRNGEIINFHDLTVSKDEVWPVGYIVDFTINDCGEVYRTQLRIY